MHETENRYAPDTVKARLAANATHRDIVGGMWDVIGPLQLGYLKTAGHAPDMSLLDVGCGALRGGQHILSYLQPRKYYGFDASEDLIELGYAHELTDAQKARLPRSQLASGQGFAFPTDWPIVDGALAFSLFTHLTINTIELCLRRLGSQVAPGGRLHATIFEVEREEWSGFHMPSPEHPNIRTWPTQDPYHYTHTHLEDVASRSGWRLGDIRDFGHPRGQRMAVLERLA